ncbi:MAG: glycosyltransferase [Alcanivorax sp.]|uniref:glycosyltransferase n=1 Tax=Alcanivorax sp. TaxID=1872427 RepID=UPI0026080610|nr:glycosyltransferase [Alcanivorax sp.]MDF1723033.1 glycosyltransferase [Alcanivorax sp.]
MLEKRKTKVLIVTYAYPPVSSPGAMRAYHFANDLAVFGHDVTVLKCSNPYSSMIGDMLPNNDAIKFIDVKDLIDKTSFSGLKDGQRRKPSFKARLLNALIYPDRDFSWIPSVLLDKRLKQSRYDFVIGTYPNATNLLLAKAISKRSSAKLVLDMRDLWTQDHSFLEKSLLKRVADKILEHKVMKSADFVINVSDFNSNVMRSFLSFRCFTAKVLTIRNGFDYEKLKKIREDFAPCSHRPEYFEMAYAGSFYRGERDPSDLFSVLQILSGKRLIKPNDFVLNIYGNPEKEIIDLVEKYRVNDFVRFEGSLCQDKLFQKLLSADCLWILTRKSLLARGEMTTKVFEYIGLGKPIVCQSGPDFEIKKVLNQVGNAFSVDFGDHSQLEKIILKLIKEKKLGRLDSLPIAERFSRIEASKELSCCLTE